MNLLKAVEKVKEKKKRNDFLVNLIYTRECVSQNRKVINKSVPFPDIEGDILVTEEVVSLKSHLPI